jgi:predicted nuclease of predicted toxin-antitoxin system
VKPLFDENLSPRLSRALADLYPDSTHVHECGLGSSDDASIWQYAKDNRYTIVPKDSDFQDRSVLLGHPPKLIWLRVGNCTSREIENLLRSASQAINHFVEKDEESYLVLGPRRRPGSSRGKSGAL